MEQGCVIPLDEEGDGGKVLDAVAFAEPRPRDRDPWGITCVCAWRFMESCPIPRAVFRNFSSGANRQYRFFPTGSRMTAILSFCTSAVRVSGLIELGSDSVGKRAGYFRISGVGATFIMAISDSVASVWVSI